MNIKFDVYEAAGVREYWVVHPEEQTVLIYALDMNGKYKGSLKPFVSTDTVSPALFPDLRINLGEVFSDNSAE